MSSLHFQRTGEKRFSGRLQLNNRENKIHSGHKKVPRNKSAVYTPVSAVSPKKRAAEEEAGGKVLSKKVKAGELTGSEYLEYDSLPDYDGGTRLPQYNVKSQIAKTVTEASVPDKAQIDIKSISSSVVQVFETAKVSKTPEAATGTIATENTVALPLRVGVPDRSGGSITPPTLRAGFPADGTSLAVHAVPSMVAPDLVELEGIYDCKIVDEPAFDALMAREYQALVAWLDAGNA